MVGMQGVCVNRGGWRKNGGRHLPPLKGVRTMNRRETRQGLKQGFSSDSAFAQSNAAVIYSLSAAFRVKKDVFNEVRI